MALCARKLPVLIDGWTRKVQTN